VAHPGTVWMASSASVPNSRLQNRETGLRHSELVRAGSPVGQFTMWLRRTPEREWAGRRAQLCQAKLGSRIPHFASGCLLAYASRLRARGQEKRAQIVAIREPRGAGVTPTQILAKFGPWPGERKTEVGSRFKLRKRPSRRVIQHIPKSSDPSWRRQPLDRRIDRGGSASNRSGTGRRITAASFCLLLA